MVVQPLRFLLLVHQFLMLVVVQAEHFHLMNLLELLALVAAQVVLMVVMVVLEPQIEAVAVEVVVGQTLELLMVVMVVQE
jgi:hypothetical protein